MAQDPTGGQHPGTSWREGIAEGSLEGKRLVQEMCQTNPQPPGVPVIGEQSHSGDSGRVTFRT